MADEAFALSPISARAALPSEEDYDAISAAFMETSRGRWFLGEYAKRNRNADTRMVLDAVARIEDSIAAQRQPPPESGLKEALAAIRNAVDQAEVAAAAAVGSIAAEESLAPIRKGVRVIREISWRWREIGADARICDLIDSQVNAIEGACGQISSTSPRGPLRTAFDLIRAEIAEFDADDAAPAQAAAEAVTRPSPAPSDDMPGATETAAEIPDVMAEAVNVTDELPEETAEVADLSAEAANADDEALLDLIALEMAAPDPDDMDAPDIDGDEILVAESTPARPIASTPAEPIIVAQKPQPIAAAAQPSLEPPLEPSLEPSLGSTLIANGILRSRRASESDPLAPIRRMSQIEKIAFFS
jgi:hypothetical protein